MKISLSPKFIKETFLLFRGKSIKEIVFGKKVAFDRKEKEAVRQIENNFSTLQTRGGRKGSFVRMDPIHKGKGTVWLVPNILGNEQQESLLIFSEDTHITQGPDLYLYLSPAQNPRNGYGDYLNLGLLKGTKGGQSYVIQQPIAQLRNYHSVVVDCKQFAVLFTFAPLA